ncbi:hypothetical protein GLOIN_2v1787106 [Rhizophagus irregularis DAOM 181602=DAOM 197198]|nr:hypothetical protein GLOIN_2v1787106 [Rhizophagus irregularis DAOM 181602=DAOM 197198]
MTGRSILYGLGVQKSSFKPLFFTSSLRSIFSVKWNKSKESEVLNSQFSAYIYRADHKGYRMEASFGVSHGKNYFCHNLRYCDAAFYSEDSISSQSNWNQQYSTRMKISLRLQSRNNCIDLIELIDNPEALQSFAHVVIIKGKIDADTMIIWKVNIALSDIEELKELKDYKDHGKIHIIVHVPAATAVPFQQGVPQGARSGEIVLPKFEIRQ